MDRKLISWGLYGLAAVVLIFVVWWFLTEPGRQAQKAADAKGGQVVAEGSAQMAGESAKAQIDLARRQAEREQLSTETENAIRDTPGADARLDPGLHDAGLDRFCLRDAYANDPRCADRVAVR